MRNIPRPCRRSTQRKGAVLVLVAFALIAILAIAALTIDGGRLQANHRDLQNAADSTAIAAAIEVGSKATTVDSTAIASASTWGKSFAAKNGYTNASNITVNVPPTSGAFSGNSRYAEVIVTSPFSNMLTSGGSTVKARAVAGSSSTAGTVKAAILCTDGLSAKSFWTDNSKLTVTGGYVMANSISTTAIYQSTNGNTTDSSGIRTTGNYLHAGTYAPTPTTPVVPEADPYATLPIPNKNTMTSRTAGTQNPVSGKVTLNPGYYNGGLLCPSGDVTFNAGVYYIDGGDFWINTTGSVTANNVFIYYAGGGTGYSGFSFGIAFCPTDKDYVFTSPTSGPYAGVSLMQSSSSSLLALYDIWGVGNLKFDAVYMPGNQLRVWSCDTGHIECDQHVGKSFKTQGAHDIYGNTYNAGFSTVTWQCTAASTPTIKPVALVE